jgi:hypothetical protein
MRSDAPTRAVREARHRPSEAHGAAIADRFGMTTFARTVDRASKRHRGRTIAEDTPVSIRTGIRLSPRFEERIRTALGAHIGHAGTLLERATVRFEDVNGPRGGDDTVCRIKLVISGRPSLIVEHRAATPRLAFAEANHKVRRALERTRGKHGLSVGGGRRSSAPKRRDPMTSADEGSIMGRRVGRGRDSLERALERPEKQRRDAYVDTAKPGASATDRKAGGNITARRNTRAKHTRATVMLEDSRTRPSRKSTRRSANRAKASQGKERTAVAASMTPGARASRR